jgi:hypothetical protein
MTPVSNRYHNFFENGAVCFRTSSVIERIPALRSPTAAECLLEVIDDYRFRARARGKARVRVWKERGRAYPVKDEATLPQKMEYIHLNPVKEGYVERAKDWTFSSAAWYASGTGPIIIDWFDG